MMPILTPTGVRQYSSILRLGPELAQTPQVEDTVPCKAALTSDASHIVGVLGPPAL